MVIELRVVQFWSGIMLVISNRTRATRLLDFKITRMISNQIALHLVQLSLFIIIIIIIIIIIGLYNMFVPNGKHVANHPG